MHIERSIRVAASPDVLFDIYIDVEKWNEWDPETMSASLIGPAVPGTRGTLVPAKGRAVQIVVTEVVLNSLLTVESRLPLFRMAFEHRLLPIEGGTEVTHKAEFSGPLSFLLGKMLIRQLSVSLPITLRNLKDRAEAVMEARGARSSDPGSR